MVDQGVVDQERRELAFLEVIWRKSHLSKVSLQLVYREPTLLFLNRGLSWKE